MSQAFRRRVLAITRAVPHGAVVAYGEIATLAGSPRAARAVGNIMRSLGHDEEDVPWHRVVNASLRISFRGATERAIVQRKRLELEGVEFDRNDVIAARFHWDLEGAPHYLNEPVAPWEPPDDWDDNA